jgi:hypothetical protein
MDPDPDPGGPKTCGSGTLAERMENMQKEIFIYNNA